MSLLLTLPIVLPLFGAAVATAVAPWRTAQRLTTAAVGVVVVVAAVVLLVEIDTQGPVVAQAGGWPAPIGISYVADRFAAIMLLVAAVILLAGAVYTIGQRRLDEEHPSFHPLYLVLAAGIASSFLAGDLFNLFVSFEVMLSASYVLLTLGGRREQVRAGMVYVVVSLVASLLFLAAVGFVYAATGTVNLADLAVRLAAVPGGVRQALVLLLLVVFGVKAAVFPLFVWLPDSYPAAPRVVGAVFAGLLTKVGVYAMFRTQTLLLEPGQRPTTVLLVIAAATMLVGVLGAIAHHEMPRILSFHIVSQIGYMVMGLAFFTVAGLAGAIFYIVHHIVVKTTLFFSAALVERTAGTSDIDRLGGLVRRAPFVALVFLLPALSLAGVPPFSGFVAKLALVEAGTEAQRFAVVGVSLLVSLLTLFSMTKIWGRAFWGAVPSSAAAPTRLSVGEAAAPAGLAALSIVIAVVAGPLYALCSRAARDLLDPSHYLVEVLG